jgi:hypothetical protein
MLSTRIFGKIVQYKRLLHLNLQIESNQRIGYKGFNADWTCRGFQYKVGQTYTMPKENVQMCRQGFHYCTNINDVGLYYNNVNSKYAMIQL